MIKSMSDLPVHLILEIYHVTTYVFCPIRSSQYSVETGRSAFKYKIAYLNEQGRKRSVDVFALASDGEDESQVLIFES